MTVREILFLFSLSISFPAISCCIAWFRIDRSFYSIVPILICSTTGLALEIFLYNVNDPDLFNICINIFLFIELALMQLQFYLWNRWLGRNYLLLTLASLKTIWFITILVTGSLYSRNSIFIICYSLSLVITAVNVINRQVFATHAATYRYQYLFCIAILLLYNYSAVVEIFLLNYELFSEKFVRNVHFIRTALNTLANILIAIAILCIPKKRKFLLSY